MPGQRLFGATASHQVGVLRSACFRVPLETPAYGGRIMFLSPRGQKRKKIMGNRISEKTQSLSGARVMVIDDSNTIRRSAEMFLRQAGCKVILAENGFDALAKVTSEGPDLIFVDALMPRLDGFQFCSLMKKNAKHKNTPIVMLSSKDGIYDRARGLSAGSVEYVTKPFTRENLLRVVGTYLLRPMAA